MLDYGYPPHWPKSLTHPDAQTIYVYRAGQSGAETLIGIIKIAGEGPVAGFELDLAEIWAGL